MNKYILILILSCCAFSVHSQHIDSEIDNSTPEERAAQLAELNKKEDPSLNLSTNELQKMLDSAEKIELPPLSVFLNAAYDNATIKRKEAELEGMHSEYKITRNQWLTYFRVNASYSYGVFSSLTNTSDTETPLFRAYSGRAQHTYNLGAGISFSIGDLVNQKHKRDSKKAALKQIQYAYEEVVEERKLKILNAYNSVVEQLAVIKAKSEAAAMYNAQMKISETEFINGQISLISLSLERGRRSGALVSFQECKVQLHNAITLLELLTNIKITDKK